MLHSWIWFLYCSLVVFRNSCLLLHCLSLQDRFKKVRWHICFAKQIVVSCDSLINIMVSSVSPKDEIWFLRVCLHISNAVCRLLLDDTAFSISIHYWRIVLPFNSMRVQSEIHNTNFSKMNLMRVWPCIVEDIRRETNYILHNVLLNL
jgi:hypothetical protein